MRTSSAAKLFYYAYDYSTSPPTPDTGSSGNHTIKLYHSGAVGSPSTPTSITEVDSTNAPGLYMATFAAAINGDVGIVAGKSSNSDVRIVGVQAFPEQITANNGITSAMMTDGLITDAKFTVPSESAGRPSTILAMLVRMFRLLSPAKKVRNRSTGVVSLYAENKTTVLEAVTQSTTGSPGSEVDTIEN